MVYQDSNAEERQAYRQEYDQYAVDSRRQQADRYNVSMPDYSLKKYGWY